MAGTAAGRTAGQGGMARPDQPRPPRRLAMVVGRRVLVDDQHEHAAYVAEALRNSRDGVLAEVATQLRTLRRPSNWHGRLAHDNDPLVVARLRGGTAPSRDWRDEPTACAVICATPDMWGSRLLLRGYGTAPRARSREAGLLALDAAVVVDEAHLSGQLLTTARRIARLVSVADEPITAPGLQVVETTATPGHDTTGGPGVGVEPQDLADEPVLRDRMTKPKPVRLVSTKDWRCDSRAAASRRGADGRRGDRLAGRPDTGHRGRAHRRLLRQHRRGGPRAADTPHRRRSSAERGDGVRPGPAGRPQTIAGQRTEPHRQPRRRRPAHH